MTTKESAKRSTKKWRTKNADRYAAVKDKWRRENIHKARTAHRRWMGLPEPLRPEPETCECCGGPPNGKGSLHLDHCHATMRFRGWLCSRCNVAIGGLGDNLEGLQRAVRYLERNNG